MWYNTHMLDLAIAIIAEVLYHTEFKPGRYCRKDTLQYFNLGQRITQELYR